MVAFFLVMFAAGFGLYWRFEDMLIEETSFFINRPDMFERILTALLVGSIGWIVLLFVGVLEIYRSLFKD